MAYQQFKKIAFLMLCVLVSAVIFTNGGTHDPWDGTLWDTASPDIDQLAGINYKEIYDLRKGIAIRLNKEHETLATSSAGGVHKQGSARAFFQDAAPTTKIDGTAWDSGDTGSLWFDTNSSPDNLVYVLTDSASTGTWTLLSVSMTAEIVAAAHSWADVQTFDLQSVHTLGILSNGAITLGAGDDLIGSATSDITINTNKFTVDGATGNTVVGGTAAITGTLEATGLTTVADGSLTKTSGAPTTDAMIANKKYVDDQVPTTFFNYYNSADAYNASPAAANTWYTADLTGSGLSGRAMVFLKLTSDTVMSMAVRAGDDSHANQAYSSISGLSNSDGASTVRFWAANVVTYVVSVTDAAGSVDFNVGSATATIQIRVVGYIQ